MGKAFSMGVVGDRGLGLSVTILYVMGKRWHEGGGRSERKSKMGGRVGC